MEVEGLFWLLLLGSALFFLFGRRQQRPSPPGPRGYPLIGNLLTIGAEFHKTCLEHKRQYGPITRFKMGLQKCVILHDVKLIKEAFNDSAFSGRPISAITEFLAGKRDGIFQAEGRLWVEQRRFALKTFRDFKGGKARIGSVIMEEVKELSDWILKQAAQPISLDGRINLAVVDSLWTIIAGQRYEHDNPLLLKIITELDVASGFTEKGKAMAFLLAYYPKLAEWIPSWSGWNELKKLSQSRQDFLQRIIEEHRATRVEDEPRDFIDAYLSHVDKSQDPSSSFNPATAMGSLQSVVADYFVAGQETTAVTLSWAILYLIHFQDVQKKLHAELDRVLGKSRLPTLTDRSSLPYVEAFIMEVLRFSSMIPLGVGHRTMEDVQFHGFWIEKGTKVLANAYAVHHDSMIWGDPETFRPERFLSADGLTAPKNENLIPFSTGKRICIALDLAQDQLFLFIASLVQQFDVEPEPGKPKPTLVPRAGQLTLSPQQYSVVMKERK